MVRKEESAIDLVVISSDMAEELVEIVIDEDRGHILTSLTKTMNNTQKNPAYGRHQLSRPMRIVGPIQF